VETFVCKEKKRNPLGTDGGCRNVRISTRTEHAREPKGNALGDARGNDLCNEGENI